MSDVDTTLFTKLYRSFLSSGGTLEIEQLITPFIETNPFLHQKAGSMEVDTGAFVYSLLRLPQIVFKVKEIVLAQSKDIFKREGYEIDNCLETTAPARRRKMYYDGNEKLFVIINSVTDVDDLVCLLTSFQIEWNKIRNALVFLNDGDVDKIVKDNNFGFAENISNIDNILWQKLYKILKADFAGTIKTIKRTSVEFKLKLLRGSYIDYVNSTQSWFENIVRKTQYPNFKNQPIYFVSSNTHSIVNTITGFVNSIEADLVKYMEEKNMDDLMHYYTQITQKNRPGSKENLLWYVLKKFELDNPLIRESRIRHEQELGIDYIEAKDTLDVNVQLINLNKLHNSHLAKRLNSDIGFLKDSNAVILNIDYPLGFGAYMVLSTIMRNIQQIRGVYILGKASFLNGKLGDIALPTQIFDDHTRNTFILKNAFTKEYFPSFEAGSILTDQNCVSTKGTLLYPEDIMKKYFIDGYTVIEMEDGPYLNALYETVYYERYPTNTLLDMLKSQIDIGIIHYASDTPFTKTVTLGTRSLGYEGVESTYNSSLAILKRIVEIEKNHI